MDGSLERSETNLKVGILDLVMFVICMGVQLVLSIAHLEGSVACEREAAPDS